MKGKNPFQDVRVRQAFYQAIDDQRDPPRVMRGQSQPDRPDVAPASTVLPARRRHAADDPEAAKKLLAEAGYPNGFGVTLDCPNDRYVNDEAICQAATVDAGAHRREGDAERADPRSSISPRSAARGYNTSFYMLGWTPGTFDAHNAIFNLLGHRNGKRGVFNNGGCSNAKIDELLDRIAVETDAAKRQAMITRRRRSPTTRRCTSRCTSRRWSGPRARTSTCCSCRNDLPAPLRPRRVAGFFTSLSLA